MLPSTFFCLPPLPTFRRLWTGVTLRFEAISVFQTQRSTWCHLDYFTAWFSNRSLCVRVCVFESERGRFCDVPCEFWLLCDNKKKFCDVIYCRLDTMRIGLWCWHWAGRSRGGDCLKGRPWDKKGWAPLAYMLSGAHLGGGKCPPNILKILHINFDICRNF